MSRENFETISEAYGDLVDHFGYWAKVADIVDQLIDLIINYRQSGHPGGSRSKVQPFITLLLSGVMRWDIRHPEKRFADRFILLAGHTVPLVYCALAVLNEAMRLRYEESGDPRYLLGGDPSRVLYYQDLLTFRQRGGLSGHAEMAGKTLFLKFNTGPSGHGSSAAVGEALALKRAGLDEVKVFALEGEAGLTPGGNHEAMNSAWGLGLDNLYFILDWNDYGIDDHPLSSTVYGTPYDWFDSHGWRVFGVPLGSEWGPLAQGLLEMVLSSNPENAPSVTWVKTRKGRGYLKYDNLSHGSPHKLNCEVFWETKRAFAEKYGVTFTNFRGKPPRNSDELKAEFSSNLEAVMNVLHKDKELITYLSDRLLELGDSVPQEIPRFALNTNENPFKDMRFYDYENYPEDLYVKPGNKVANRAALGKWGAWVNALGAEKYGRPLILACSADLAGSTNIAGFGDGYGDFSGYGWYNRYGSCEGALLPQEITEFANAGIMAGLVTVNLATDAEREFNGFWGACSTYGAFSYLKYGMFRLFSQLAQDCPWKLGKILWIVGHSGPETADDSRTHFGIFSPGVTQLFPKGQIINLHPWEYNEVPVLLGAALQQKINLVALHLTRPAIEIPDRNALSIPSHFAAARGAYVIRDYRDDQPRGGAVVVQGTLAMANVLKILSQLANNKLNVKIICATSPELFALQPESYRESVLSPVEHMDSTVITTQARSLMHAWLFNEIAEEYALSADWDDKWRTGGTLDQVADEAHLSPDWLLGGIERFVRDREKRLQKFRYVLH